MWSHKWYYYFQYHIYLSEIISHLITNKDIHKSTFLYKLPQIKSIKQLLLEIYTIYLINNGHIPAIIGEPNILVAESTYTV